jgi:hypothetical protein
MISTISYLLPSIHDVIFDIIYIYRYFKEKIIYFLRIKILKN